MPNNNIEKKLDILLREKEMVFKEKLQLIQTTKQTISFLGIVTGLLLGSAYRYEIKETFILIPFVINAFCYYLLTNLNTLLLVSQFINHLDNKILYEIECKLPLYQTRVGSRMTEWGLNITKDKGYITPNPYYLFGGFVAIIALGFYFVSVYEGWKYLWMYCPYWIAWTFISTAIGSLFLLIFVSIRYLNYRHRIRSDSVD